MKPVTTKSFHCSRNSDLVYRRRCACKAHT